MSTEQGAAGQQAGFNVYHHLERRATADPFAVVEIGHGRIPIAHKLAPLTGQRTYIGIETWFYDLPVVLENYKQHLKNSETQPGLFQNAAFINQHLGADDDPAGGGIQRCYRQLYDPRTILPDGVADELFLGNVMCDPRIGQEKGRSEAMLTECARLIGKTGVVVFRETITPTVAQLDDKTLALAGLVAVHQEQRTPGSLWDELETAYNGAADIPWHRSNDAFYLFAKQQG